ncbi:hypothetical protein PGT21_018558 [Puccinia graminis f. sp. tritici]|uniref:Uncharacterized protein n=2 Tax=Puccinia graminis f. sp. tritici TaxID=56615 RepID=E3K177_PUCGT|nr:uncharacterized protein PGTG_04008 [Puccinia graminis f. sp. tritici CRL 75-36-700-3]KAA1096484.1 hypothetical protein PGT21_018235 [Puccinia graminis f. sp. tritici]EFP78052.1 hypothetical protein PGTG_04008 [Puccinia graminis f. sp. tritici CRL 75-36-700-3]KAA1113013.1 hypothetical protein PGT21_018558 [Puccinia graminis f. sp. tritici]KAA1131953.1 hypothetical protein PGTUg99_034460 [Puccinia graminis f. sp. tritici]KAA1135838.1 hypothetical protein PGTUg99_029322 [Puccinia graminis f. s
MQFFFFLLATFTLLIFRVNGQGNAPEVNRVGLTRSESMPMRIQRRGSSSLVSKLAKGLKIGSPGKSVPQKVAFKGPSKDFDPSSAAATKTIPDALPGAQIPKTHPDTIKTSASKTSASPMSKKNEAPEIRPGQPYRPSEAAADQTKPEKKDDDEKEKSSKVSTVLNGAKKAFDILKPESPNEKDAPSETSEASTFLKLKNEESGLVKDGGKETDSMGPTTSD